MLIQYVDDLLVARETADPCFQAFMSLLQQLAKHEFKVSKDKLHLVRTEVQFSGRIVSQRGTGMMGS